MILDIIVIALMVIPAALGIYRGFLNMFVRTTGWIIAGVAGFFLKDTVAGFVETSSLGEMIHQRVAEKFASSAESVIMAVESLPQIIKGGITASAESASEILAGMFSEMLISVVCFIAIVLTVWLLLKITVKPANKRKRGGIIDTSDKMLGFAIGFLEGVCVVFVFMTILLVVVNFADISTTQQILTMLQDSVIASVLYDNNLLLLITGGLMG